jgi:hypothetical protein
MSLRSLLFAETGVPVRLGLFCEVNATVLLSTFTAVGVHSATRAGTRSTPRTGAGCPRWNSTPIAFWRVRR